jgi:hypothetical protein
MKKVLVVLLILAVAGGVFAQDLTWSGTVETGVHINKTDGADDVVVWADNDDGVQGIRAKLQAAITGDSWGFKVGIKNETTNWAAAGVPGLVELYNGYGWLDLLNKMINVKAGIIDDGVWTTKGDEDWGIATGSGVRIEVAPIEGLSVGAFLTWPKGDTVNAISKAATLEQFFNETAIGFSYTADVFYVSGGLKLDSDGDPMGTYFDFADSTIGDGDDAGTPTGTDDDINMKILIGFGYTGIEALTAKIEGNIWNLGEGDYRVMWFNETIAYKVMEPLTVGAVLTEKLFGYSDIPMYLKVKPYVEYSLNDTMSVGLNIPVVLWDGLESLAVNPWFKYAVGNASFKVGYTATSLAERTDNDVLLRPDSALNHDIQATFVWSF